MNILMAHPHDIYSSSEPWTIRITSIAREFVRMGHKVKLVYFPLPKKERGLLKMGRITEYETIPFNRSKWHIAANISRMIQLGEWADVIYFQKCFAIASLPSIISGYWNKKHIHYDWDDWEYGIYMYSPPSRLYGSYLDILERTIPSLVDTVSVASDELRNMAMKRGVAGKSIVKANVCADLQRFRPLSDGSIRKKYNLTGNVILYLGQLHGAQYAQILLYAAVSVLKKSPDTKFLIVGGGSDLDRLKELAKNLGISQSVVFTGFVPDEDVVKCIASADIAVACFEQTRQVRCKSPLKVAEYMASGKAIVASNIGEVPWMLGETGILTVPGDVESLSEGIVKLLGNPVLRKELEKKARKRAESLLDWKIVAEKILSQFQSRPG